MRASATYGPTAVPRIRRRNAATASATVALLLLAVNRPIGPASTAPIDIALTVAILIAVFVAARERRHFQVPFLVPVGCMVAAGAIAAVLGEHPELGAVTVGQDLFLLAWAAALANAARTRDGATGLLRAWSFGSIAGAGLLVATYAAGLTAVAGVDPDQGARAAFTFRDQNSAALYFVVSVALVLAGRYPRGRVARAVSVALLVAATVLTGSLAGFLGLGVVIAAAWFASVYRRRGAAASVVAVCLACLSFAGIAGLARSQNLFQKAASSRYALVQDSLGRERDSTAGRAELARQTIELFAHGPVLGIGPAATKATLVANQAPYPKEAHNDYVATIVERGVLGALGLLLLIAVVAAHTRNAMRATSGSGTAALLPAGAYLAGAVAAIATFATTHEVLHERTVWALFGLIAGIGMWGSASHGRETGRDTA